MGSRWRRGARERGCAACTHDTNESRPVDCQVRRCSARDNGRAHAPKAASPHQARQRTGTPWPPTKGLTVSFAQCIRNLKKIVAIAGT